MSRCLRYNNEDTDCMCSNCEIPNQERVLIIEAMNLQATYMNLYSYKLTQENKLEKLKSNPPHKPELQTATRRPYPVFSTGLLDIVLTIAIYLIIWVIIGAIALMLVQFTDSDILHWIGILLFIFIYTPYLLFFYKTFGFTKRVVKESMKKTDAKYKKECDNIDEINVNAQAQLYKIWKESMVTYETETIPNYNKRISELEASISKISRDIPERIADAQPRLLEIYNQVGIPETYRDPNILKEVFDTMAQDNICFSRFLDEYEFSE